MEDINHNHEEHENYNELNYFKEHFRSSYYPKVKQRLGKQLLSLKNNL